MVKLVFALLFAVVANAQNLQFLDGEIKAHTEVFGDSNINPFSKKISSDLSIDKTIDSLKGTVSLDTLSFHSDNEKRDLNMYEVLHSSEFPHISFTMTSLQKVEDSYEITGFLTLNGLKKEIKSKAQIKEENQHLILDGNFSINLTSFNLEPPTLLFLTVRDQIDITYHLDYLKG